MGPSVLTIGHSNLSAEELLALLKLHAVAVVADVRSAPYSRVAPAFNRHALSRSLEEAGVKYVFLGEELGGRSKLAMDYDSEGRVKYSRMAKSEMFREGIQRVLRGAENYRVALLCAEKDPIQCHRTLLVARELEKRGASIAHIHSDGRLERNDEAMARLLALHGMQELGLFDGRDRLIDKACDLQARRVAYQDRRMTTSAEPA